MNVYKKINDWLVDNYSPLNKWIYFNATPSISGVVALNTVAGNRVTRRFITGIVEREVIFAIDMVKTYDSQGTSDTNLLAVDEVNNFIEWLDTQKKEKNYPDFGEKYDIKDMEVLTNVPDLLINTQDMLAKYQFQCRIVYNDETEV